MFTLSGIIYHLVEALAITVAVYLVTRKTLQWKDMITLVITISVTFMILDLFAPKVAVGARQGSGFGLGFMQVAGDTPYPHHYYDTKVVEGMDDQEALKYRWSPSPNEINEHPDLIPDADVAQIPSIISQQYSQNPFKNLAPAS